MLSTVKSPVGVFVERLLLVSDGKVVVGSDEFEEEGDVGEVSEEEVVVVVVVERGFDLLLMSVMVMFVLLGVVIEVDGGYVIV
jgi:hypothetical protein